MTNPVSNFILSCLDHCTNMCGDNQQDDDTRSMISTPRDRLADRDKFAEDIMPVPTPTPKTMDYRS